jgi:hypothetical protein
VTILSKRVKVDDGLIPINCAECGRDLDRAQPEFLAKHPNPKCYRCNNPSESDESDSSDD